jgi:hypothetical protein
MKTVFLCLIVSLVLVMGVLCCMWFSYIPEQKFPVDFVITWVDTYDPEREYYRQLYDSSGNGKNRYTDNGELKFALRSICKNCPWFNKIYIVVKDGQKPNFINFDCERIILINHSQIIPKEYLPTFNSITIEQYIHKIPNLSSHYIYSNDDVFIFKKTQKSTFFYNGLPMVAFKRDKEQPNDEGLSLDSPYCHSVMLKNTLTSIKDILSVNYNIYMLHTPSPCYKPWEEELECLLKKNGLWFNTRFRTNRNIAVNNYLRNIFYYIKGSRVSNWKDKFISSLNPSDDCKMHCRGKQFVCVNVVNEECVPSFLNQIEAQFPEKSPFEN